MKIRTTIGTLATAAALSVASGAAVAGTVNLGYQGGNAWGTEAWVTGVNYTLDGVARSHGSGAFQVQDTDTGTTFVAWCIDLLTTLDLSYAYDDTTPSATAAQLDNINKLFTTAYEFVNSANTASGFQIALWEIMSDTGNADGLDLTNGSFVTTGTGEQYTQAAKFLDGMSGASGSAYALATFYSANSQNLVTGTPASSAAAAVPLPASALLLLGSFGGLVAMRRRKTS